MKIVKDKIKIDELKEMAEKMYGNLVKAVVDVEKEIMAVDGELHADEEKLLIEKGSHPKNLWGINLYPDLQTKDWIEFDSVINVKPHLGNRTRGIDNSKIKERVIKIVTKLIER